MGKPNSFAIRDGAPCHSQESDWNDFVNTAAPVIRRYIYKRVQNGPAADDLVQETFIRFISNLDKYDPSRDPLPWLLTIARNLTCDYFREMEKAINLDDDSDVLVRASLIQRRRVQERIEQDDLMVWLSSRMDLSEQEALIFFSYYRHGLKPRDIAQATGLAAKTISNKLSVIRCQLSAMRTDVSPDDFRVWV